MTVKTEAEHPLLKAFRCPPEDAKPRVWWHWMNGNVTKEGIALDIDWMAKVGVAGFHAFDAGLYTPQVVEKRLSYMDDGWRDAFRFALSEAEKHSFEVGIAASPGWSETGGPWVTPEQAMKKLVWTETAVSPDDVGTVVLSRPHETSGSFQNFPNPGHSAFGQTDLSEEERYYEDVRVIAFPLPDAEATSLNVTSVHSNDGPIAAEKLCDNDYVGAISISVPESDEAWVEFDLGEARTIRAVSVAMAPENWARPKVRRPAPRLGWLEASTDGKVYQALADIPGYELGRSSAPQHTVSLPTTTARYFRLRLASPPRDADHRTALFPPEKTKIQQHMLSQFVLHQGARLNRFEEKAGFGTLMDYYAAPGHCAEPAATVSVDQVIDLTHKMRPDGTLDWRPGAGRWMVLRIGMSLVGTKNHPASPEATGLEVDKLNRDHVKTYLDRYFRLYENAGGFELGKFGINAVVTDSWEAGIQNWTRGFAEEFHARRGYDIQGHLPALFGWIVGSDDATERFLWDFRKTIGEMVVDNHYGQIRESLDERGLIHYAESMERERPTLGDGMAFKKRSDVPMGAFWTRRAENEDMPNYGVDLRESASVANVYGKKFVAAESLTTNGTTNGWSDSPRTLKPFADRMLELGVNRFVMHTSVHQPLADTPPGLTLGPYGYCFNRHETWAHCAKAWVDYITRCSTLLQFGRTVADIGFLYGEEGPITAVYVEEDPREVPEGYTYDFINNDALHSELSVEDGMITARTGARYAVLYAGGQSCRMTVATVEKLRALVEAGATLIAERPIGSPSLADRDEDFTAACDALWGSGGPLLSRGVGRGRVCSGKPLARILDDLRLERDFDYSRTDAATRLAYLHRSADGTDLYFVRNTQARREATELSFRVTGREPEVWCPVTGKTRTASYRIGKERSYVQLILEPNETVFVVFSRPAERTEHVIPQPVINTLQEIHGPWTVQFQKGRGAPDNAEFDRLYCWTEHADPGIRHFSGTATYRSRIDIPAKRDRERLIIDLGEVREIAVLRVNGLEIAQRWTYPYRFDITDAVRVGVNQLEIEVTNLWRNRLIGDCRSIGSKITHTAFPVYTAASELIASGLLGPARLQCWSKDGGKEDCAEALNTKQEKETANGIR
nr:glycosyl hydrolase [Pseudoruegeria sp. HB172150]